GARGGAWSGRAGRLRGRRAAPAVRRDLAAVVDRGAGGRVDNRLWPRPLPRARPAGSPTGCRGRRGGCDGRGREDGMIGTLAQIDYLASNVRTPWHRASALGKLIVALAILLTAVFAPGLRLLLALYLMAWTLVLSSRLP